jgi:hypothetical protein
MKEGCSLKGLAISVGIFALVLASVFTVVWIREAYDFEVCRLTLRLTCKSMARAECTVFGAGTTMFTCEVRRCTGTHCISLRNNLLGVGKDKHCETHYYSCWSAYWDVKFSLPNNTVVMTNVTEADQYEDKLKAESQEGSHMIGTTYDVWYNKEDPKLAR